MDYPNLERPISLKRNISLVLHQILLCSCFSSIEQSEANYYVISISQEKVSFVSGASVFYCLPLQRLPFESTPLGVGGGGESSQVVWDVWELHPESLCTNRRTHKKSSSLLLLLLVFLTCCSTATHIPHCTGGGGTRTFQSSFFDTFKELKGVLWEFCRCYCSCDRLVGFTLVSEGCVILAHRQFGSHEIIRAHVERFFDSYPNIYCRGLMFCHF